MAKVDPRRLSSKKLKAIHDELWHTVACCIRCNGATEALLRTFLTGSEHIMLARRIRIAQLFMRGSSMEEIRQALGVGLSTILLVDRMLKGGCGEYQTVFSDLHREAVWDEKIRSALINPFSFTSIRRRYPLHFLLFTLFIGDQKYLWKRG